MRNKDGIVPAPPSAAHRGSFTDRVLKSLMLLETSTISVSLYITLCIQLFIIGITGRLPCGMYVRDISIYIWYENQKMVYRLNKKLSLDQIVDYSILGEE